MIRAGLEPPHLPPRSGAIGGCRTHIGPISTMSSTYAQNLPGNVYSWAGPVTLMSGRLTPAFSGRTARLGGTRPCDPIGRLLKLDLGADLFKGRLDLFSFFLVGAFLNGLRSAFNEVL